MGQYKILNITYKDGTTRTDDRYPLRIGSIVDMKFLQTGIPMCLEYLKDNQGHKKDGYLRSSTVTGIRFNDDAEMYIVETLNSVYYLRQEYSK